MSLCINSACVPVDPLDKAGLILQLGELTYAMTYMDRPRGPQALPVSEHLAVSGTVQINKNELVDPCLAVGASCEFVGFTPYNEVSGVVIDGQGNATFTNTVVRFRGIYQENFDLEPPILAEIQVIASAATPCAGETSRCPRDLVCYRDFPQHCAYCTDFQPQVCACQSWDGALPAGTTCEYWRSYDVSIPGICSSLGECQRCSTNADCTLYPQYPRYCWLQKDETWRYGYFTHCEPIGCNSYGTCSPESRCCDQDQSCVDANTSCPQE